MEQLPRVVVVVTGERAQRGLLLSDLRRFAHGLSRALRDYDRARQGDQLGVSGHPTTRASAVTAFRLVLFQQGSGVMTLEPAVADVVEEPRLFETTPTLPVDTLRDMLRAWQAHELPGEVEGQLERARRAFGPSGRLAVRVERPGADEEEYIVAEPDAERCDVAVVPAEVEAVGQVTGRLHLIDVEPDLLGIRTASGREVRATYPEVMQAAVAQLLDQNVVAWIEPRDRGHGLLVRLERVAQPEQTEMFTLEPVSIEMLMRRGDIQGPQGVAALVDPEWADDDQSEAFLRAISE